MKNLVILLFISLSLIGYTQDESRSKKMKAHRMGLYSGINSGKGFAFRYQPDKLGIQVAGVPMFSKAKRVFFSVGVSGLYLLQKGKYTDLYSYVGGQYVESNIFEKSGRINMGGGIAMDTALSDKVSLNTRGGYGLMNITDRNTTGIFTAELGLNYKL